MNMPLTGSVMDAAKALADYADGMAEVREWLERETEAFRARLNTQAKARQQIAGRG